jgi:hypothetical protein
MCAGLLGGSIVDTNALVAPSGFSSAFPSRFDLRDPALLASQKGWRHFRPGGRGARLRNKGGEEVAMDWKQLWEILSAADNVPIVAMIPLLAFYMYLAWKQAHANDVLIEQLAGDAALAKTHHRKAWPFTGMKEVRLAVPAAQALNSWPHYRHHYSDGVVHHAERAAQEPANPNSDHNRPKCRGIFGLRKCWCTSTRGSPAWSCRLSSYRPDGHSLYRYQSLGPATTPEAASSPSARSASLFCGSWMISSAMFIGRLAVVPFRANVGCQPRLIYEVNIDLPDIFGSLNWVRHFRLP